MAKKTTTTTTTVFRYVAGLDVGNGYTKGVIEQCGDNTHRDVIDIPSSAQIMMGTNKVPMADSEALSFVTDTSDFFNNVELRFDTPLVSTNHRYVMGRRGLSAAGVHLLEFDIDGQVSKADQELSKIIVLAALTSKAVKDYVVDTGHVPSSATDGASSLTVHATVALALPINEYVNRRDGYVAQFTGGVQHQVHNVTVTNFNTPVTVQIVFDSVTVIAEGASAQYAITSRGESLATALLAEARELGMSNWDGVTPVDIVAVTNTIGVDIGEGTVNFPVFTAGRFNKDASHAFGKGYGTVLEMALIAMEEDQNYVNQFTSRKQLADYLQQQPSALKRNAYNRVNGYVQRAAEFFVEELIAQFTSVMNVVGASTEIVYVYGGGSGPLREILHHKLQAKIDLLTGGDSIPVLYLDASYSRKLNREGLMIAARANVGKQ